MSCRICGSRIIFAFTHAVLNRHDCRYFMCDRCGLLQTEEPHWLGEAYSAPIAAADTGVVLRNLTLARLVTPLLYFQFDRDGKYLDTAGGYGLFTRLMRDIGFDYHWSDDYSPNLMARGFEASGPYTAITAFEVMEHLTDPAGFVTGLLEQTDTIIFTTELFSGTPPTEDWWYYAFATGQHISFYQRSTLEFIAGLLGLQFYSSGMLHIWTRRKINRLALQVVTSHTVAPTLTGWIRRRLSPRTMNDHEQLIAHKP
jgi:Methyltransferase domain